MSDDLIKQPIIWVDSNQALEEYCSVWSEKNLLALDTEFIRSTTYYPKAGLIQVNDNTATYLIDPLEIDDWFPFIEVMDNDNIIIAMHSCSEDLEVLQMEVGAVPANILDTQIAAAFLGMESSMGYAATITHILNVNLPKGETRSNWLQRPLSQPQTYYAALDVEYLIQLAHEFQRRLHDNSQLEWVLEEGRRVYKNYKQLQNINNCHLRIKSAWKLSPRKLAVLIALSRWRENIAQQHDVPRNRVIKENALFELALHCPNHISALRDIEGIPERIIRKDGAVLIELIAAQQQLNDDDLPVPLPQPLNKSQRDTLQTLKERLKPLAGKYGIAPALFLRKKEAEILIRLWTKSDWDGIGDFFTGWRKDIISEFIIEQLKTL